MAWHIRTVPAPTRAAIARCLGLRTSHSKSRADLADRRSDNFGIEPQANPSRAGGLTELQIAKPKFQIGDLHFAICILQCFLTYRHHSLTHWPIISRDQADASIPAGELFIANSSPKGEMARSFPPGFVRQLLFLVR